MPERGLHHQALASVPLVSDRRQAIAHRHTNVLVHQSGPVEGTEVGQHLPRQFRMAHDERWPGAEPDLYEVTVARQRIQQLQRAALQLDGVAEQRPGSRRPPEPHRGSGLVLAACSVPEPCSSQQ